MAHMGRFSIWCSIIVRSRNPRNQAGFDVLEFNCIVVVVTTQDFMQDYSKEKLRVAILHTV